MMIMEAVDFMWNCLVLIWREMQLQDRIYFVTPAKWTYKKFKDTLNIFMETVLCYLLKMAEFVLATADSRSCAIYSAIFSR